MALLRMRTDECCMRYVQYKSTQKEGGNYNGWHFDFDFLRLSHPRGRSSNFYRLKYFLPKTNILLFSEETARIFVPHPRSLICSLQSARFFSMKTKTPTGSISTHSSTTSHVDELQSQVDHYKRIIESAGDIIYLLDATGVFTYVNDAGIKLSGFDRDEIVGKNYIDLLHPSHHETVRQLYRKQRMERIPITYFECPFVKKDGSILWIGQNVILLEENDCVVGFEGISRDITEQREWKSQMEKLTVAIHQAVDMMVITDLGGRIEFVNDAFERQTGYTLEEVKGKKTSILKSGVHTKEFYQTLWDTVNSDKVWSGTIKNRKKDGTLYDEEMTISPMHDEKGILTHFVAIKRDVTEKLQKERTYQEHYALLHALLASVEQGIELDLGRKITWVNDAMCKMFGYTREELIGQSTRMFYESEEIYERIGSEAMAHINERGVYTTIINARKKSGEFFECEVFGTLIDPTTPSKGMVGVFADITEKRRAEKSLRESLAFQQAVLRSVEQGVEFDIDRQFRWVNEAMCRMFGYSREEFLHQSTRMIYESEEVYESVGRELRQQIVQKGFSTSSVRARKKSGELFECEIYGTPIDRNDLSLGSVGVFTDVTERKRNEEAREKLTVLLKSIIDGSSQYSIIATDRNGIITIFNRGAEMMLGYRAEELVGKQTPYIIRDPEEIAAVEQQIYEQTGTRIQGFDAQVYLATKQPHYELECSYVHKDGVKIPVRLTITAMRDGAGSITGFLGIARDITEELKSKQHIDLIIEELQHSQQSLRELNVQKDKFLSIVSHDLRSPFNSILGFCEILLDPAQEVTPEESHEFLTVIHQAAELQLKLINNLLDWSRLETNRMPFKPKALLLSKMVEDNLYSLRGIAHKKRLTFTNTVPKNIEIHGDEALIQQLIQNLIGNALKFTPDGGTIHVGATQQKKMVEVFVQDNGVGMPDSALEQLFRIDTMFHTQGTQGERGSGLGLLLCKEIVNKHQGTIRVESELEKGTTFYFTLPLVHQSKILIVDDSPGDRLLYKKYMAQVFPNFVIIEASNGYEGITMAIEHHPSLILLDFNMPVMDGLRFLEEMKRNHEIENLRAVVITGVDSNASHDKLLEAGALTVVDKPLTKSHFEELINKYLDTNEC